MKQISSSLTYPYKFFFLIVWTGGFLVLTLLMFLHPDWSTRNDVVESRWVFLVIAVLTTLLMFWMFFRLKNVHLTETSIVVSDLRNKTTIDLSKVERVSGSRFLNPELVWLHLKEGTTLGSKITFMAKTRFRVGFKPNPIVDELNELIANNQQN